MKILNWIQNQEQRFVFFTGDDGLQIAYYHYKLANPIAKLLFIHGWWAHSNLWYINIANELNEKYNIEVILMDLVWHGKSQWKRGDSPFAWSVYKDISKLIFITKNNSVPFYIWWHSSWWGLIINYITSKYKEMLDGYIFVSPEFWYKSDTKKIDRIDFGTIKLGYFIWNAMSFWLLFGNVYAVDLNYPKNIIDKNPEIVNKLTVNMANALTPKNPKSQFTTINKPFTIIIGSDDEMFDIQKVVEYWKLPKNLNSLSTTKIVTWYNHLWSIAWKYIWDIILEWNKK